MLRHLSEGQGAATCEKYFLLNVLCAVLGNETLFNSADSLEDTADSDRCVCV